MWNILISILTSGIVASLATFLMNRVENEKRYKKLLLDDIMGYRYQAAPVYKGDAEKFNNALNRIFIVYNSDQRVIDALKSYKDNGYKIDALVSLIKEMCKVVGIKYDNINDSFFLEPFIVGTNKF